LVHALRGTVAPLTVAIPQAWKRTNEDGGITDEGCGGRLDQLGRLVVELAGRLRPEVEAQAQPLRLRLKSGGLLTP
jgi:FMN reductase